MIKNWKQLEESARELISDDNPVQPRNSGGTKGEEDVVGSELIIQCKYTNAKNMSILKKDLDRLLENANLLEKFPIFITANGDGDLILSLPVKIDPQLIVDVIRLTIISNGLQKMILNHNLITTPDILNKYRKQEFKYKGLMQAITSKIQDQFTRLASLLDTKYKNLMMYNLFD